jgi:hypothetical protein
VVTIEIFNLEVELNNGKNKRFGGGECPKTLHTYMNTVAWNIVAGKFIL